MQVKKHSIFEKFLFVTVCLFGFLNYLVGVFLFIFPTFFNLCVFTIVFAIYFLVTFTFLFRRLSSELYIKTNDLIPKIIVSLFCIVVLPFFLSFFPVIAGVTFLIILKESILYSSFSYKLLRLSSVLFSKKNQKEVFEPIIADWQEEYFEALFKKEIWKARWINVRYTYAFLATMWMKSPIGDLIEFVIKIAKQ